MAIPGHPRSSRGVHASREHRPTGCARHAQRVHVMLNTKPAGWKSALFSAIWSGRFDARPGWRAGLIRLVRLVLVLIRDLAWGQLTMRATGLVFTTLLALVPLLALSFSVLKAFGVHNQIDPVLLEFLAPLGREKRGRGQMDHQVHRESQRHRARLDRPGAVDLYRGVADAEDRGVGQFHLACGAIAQLRPAFQRLPERAADRPGAAVLDHRHRRHHHGDAAGPIAARGRIRRRRWRMRSAAPSRCFSSSACSCSPIASPRIPGCGWTPR